MNKVEKKSTRVEKERNKEEKIIMIQCLTSDRSLTKSLRLKSEELKRRYQQEKVIEALSKKRNWRTQGTNRMTGRVKLDSPFTIDHMALLTFDITISTKLYN